MTIVSDEPVSDRNNMYIPGYHVHPKHHDITYIKVKNTSQYAIV